MHEGNLFSHPRSGKRRLSAPTPPRHARPEAEGNPLQREPDKKRHALYRRLQAKQDALSLTLRETFAG